MANDISLTGLTEILYQARDIVAREPSGFAQGVIVNGGSEGVSAGGTVTSLRTTEPTLETSYTPAMTPPDAADITTIADTLSLSLYAGVSIPLKGEQFAQLAATVGSELALQQLYKQGIRKMINQMESSIGTAAYQGASRATGTAGTTPFASNFNAINDLRQILEDNGCMLDDGELSLIINSVAGTNLRNLSQLTKVNESGSDATLRRGELLNVSGFSVRTSAGVQSHTKGAGTGYLINGAEAVGQTALTFDTGTVNTTGIKAGDIITHASDSTNKYVVKTGSTATAGDIVINYPGLRIAAADNAAITVGNSYTANLAFARSAIVLATRAPAMPEGGDSADDTIMVTDPASGLTFEIAVYRQFMQVTYHVRLAWGVRAIKPEHISTLIG